MKSISRTSYDTALKHLVRHGVLNDVLTPEQITSIPRSNISRWKNEADDKYSFCELNQLVKEELEFIKRFNSSSKIKKINQGYFKLCDTFQEITLKVKGVKALVKSQKQLVVNTIEQLKDIVPMDTALKVFNISRTTFQHYKAMVIHQCESSYFKWCTKRLPFQLLPKEVMVIKKYMTDKRYRYWSKSSVYLKAVRDKALACQISTFYKYCSLLGFSKVRHLQKKPSYKPVVTSKPNELWCADVTIFKTADGVKHYIHFLMDHYSKMILGYRVGSSSSAKLLTELLKEAFVKYRPERIALLSDGGSENVNTTVSGFLNGLTLPVQQIIAQKDVVFSNSMIEALNKVIKHQFLLPHQIASEAPLERLLREVIPIYNKERPQYSLGGNTPFETHNGTVIDFNRYTGHFAAQKALRLEQNRKSACMICK